MSNRISPLVIANDIPLLSFDGESQGNPGQGAAAAVLLMPNGRRYTVSQLLSFVTKHEAEYRGLIIGLRKAKSLGIRQIEVKGDSEVVFNQVNGLSGITEDKLRRFYLEVKRLMTDFDSFSLEWIPYEQNRSARKAVARCLQEALGNESLSGSPASSPLVSPSLRRLLQLGHQATDADLLELAVEADGLSEQTLANLRDQIPTAIQDAIAFQWEGDESDLADTYRWHLRGLPPELASRKVKLDRQASSHPPDKLPWEEALISPFATPSPTVSPSELFSALPPDDPLGMDIGNIFLSPAHFDDSNPQFASDAAILKPLNDDAELSKGLTYAPRSTLPDPMLEFSRELTDTSRILQDEGDYLKGSNDLNGALVKGDDAAELNDFLEGKLPTVPPVDSDFAGTISDHTPDNSKDTLPSEEKLNLLLASIQTLSTEDKVIFVQSLVKQTDIVHFILKAIADNVTHRPSS